MSPCNYELPPTMIEHLTNSNIPTSYYYFWSWGAVCIIITCFVLIPRINQFRKHAIKIRDERDKSLMPFSYVACLLLVSFPVAASFLKYFTFISPIAAFTIDFVIKTYEGLVIFAFTRLLIMYLGATNSINALEAASKTKFYAVPPFACCFRKCCTAATVTKQDFRTLHSFIIQYCIAAPILTFMMVLRTYQGTKWMLFALKLIGLLSAMLAFYGLLALLKASQELLTGYRIKGKFWCIKGLIASMIIPPFIIGLLHLPFKGKSSVYSEEVLVEAYGAFAAIVCFTLLSFVFLKFFKPEDALYAMHNADMKDHRASKSLANLKTGTGGDYNNVNNQDNMDEVELVKNETIGLRECKTV